MGLTAAILAAPYLIRKAHKQNMLTVIIIKYEGMFLTLNQSFYDMIIMHLLMKITILKATKWT